MERVVSWQHRKNAGDTTNPYVASLVMSCSFSWASRASASASDTTTTSIRACCFSSGSNGSSTTTTTFFLWLLLAGTTTVDLEVEVAEDLEEAEGDGEPGLTA